LKRWWATSSSDIDLSANKAEVNRGRVLHSSRKMWQTEKRNWNRNWKVLLSRWSRYTEKDWD
jgi:hypothetical protein